MNIPLLRTGLLGQRCDELLFNFSQQLHRRDILIEEIGDYIPGSVMVQDLSEMKNLYMNKTGCDILRKSTEELTALGTAYFRLFFPQNEIEIHIKHLNTFIQQNDFDITTSFFQRVRPDIHSDYKWYLTVSRLCISTKEPESSGLMHISLDVGSLPNVEIKLSSLIQENKFVSKNIRKFASLTTREREILKLIAEGKTCSAISDMLFISLHTVHNHRKHINKKLEVSSLSQLMKYAVEFLGER